MSNTTNETDEQRRYYTRTASSYDAMHVIAHDEHHFALSFMVAAVDYLGVRSILDIGSGTGRVLRYLKEQRPGLRVIGVEPVAALREVGHAHGLSRDELIDGDATNLPFKAQGFDLVCEFGVLHHIRRPENAIAEMLRVANTAIFVSDSNNFGQGTPSLRLIKRLVNLLGLWGIADLIKTRGKGYTSTEGDGVSYSYSVFNNYRQIQQKCKSVHLLNTKDGSIDIYKTASHIALLGIKKDYSTE